MHKGIVHGLSHQWTYSRISGELVMYFCYSTMTNVSYIELPFNARFFRHIVGHEHIEFFSPVFPDQSFVSHIEFLSIFLLGLISIVSLHQTYTFRERGLQSYVLPITMFLCFDTSDVKDGRKHERAGSTDSKKRRDT